MDVVFAVVPFADAGRPAMGVSLLKAELAQAGYSSVVEYYNLGFAERIGAELYQRIANSLPPELMTGEWFFADDVFGDSIPDAVDYIDQVLDRSLGSDQALAKELFAARAHRAQYLDECAAKLLSYSPRIVGFTTTFHQTCACLSLARRIKQAPNPPIVVFGGANCEGEMGLQMIRSFPWIDFICSGEADVSFPALLEELLRGAPRRSIAGVIRKGESTEAPKSEAIQDLNRLPIPDFDDYFVQLAKSALAASVEPCLTIETSRGCWWGAKHHCTFCGLNGDTLGFRSKTPERAFDEFFYLAHRHKVRRIGCVDNILDLRYVETLFPRLEATGLNLDLFYEIKANIRLDQLQKMRRGGVRHVQPGIESLSSEVLRLMEKGCTALQNIQLLRWCEELGIDVSWNILAGFPGETPEHYEAMAKLVPYLTHLAPPASCAQIRLDRFSPFHFRSQDFSMQRIRPARAYYYVFPLGRAELARLAYFFHFDYGDGRKPDDYLPSLRREVRNWWNARSQEGDLRSRLDCRIAEDGSILIRDTRPIAGAAERRLDGPAAAVFLGCDRAAVWSALLRLPEIAGNETILRGVVDELKAAALLVEYEGKFLTLAVFRNRPAALASERNHAHIPLPQTVAAEPLLRVV